MKNVAERLLKNVERPQLALVVLNQYSCSRPFKIEHSDFARASERAVNPLQRRDCVLVVELKDWRALRERRYRDISRLEAYIGDRAQVHLPNDRPWFQARRTRIYYEDAPTGVSGLWNY